NCNTIYCTTLYESGTKVSGNVLLCPPASGFRAYRLLPCRPPIRYTRLTVAHVVQSDHGPAKIKEGTMSTRVLLPLVIGVLALGALPAGVAVAAGRGGDRPPMLTPYPT